MIVKSNKNILIHPHMGLGDQLVISGLVRKIADLNPEKTVFLVTRDRIHDNINLLYSDIDQIKPCNIAFYPKPEETHNLNNRENLWIKSAQRYADMFDLELVNIGYYNYKQMNYWDRSFYTSSGIDYEVKYECFKIPINVLNLAKNKFINQFKSSYAKDYIFVHDDPKRNYNIPNPKNTKYSIVRNSELVNDYTIFDMIPILQNAKELHMMGSSLMCLCDLLDIPTTEKQKAFYYPGLRGFNKLKGIKKWIMI